MKELLFTMFKIGCIGFGGGTALVPVIESEVVYEKKLIDKDEYTKDVVVATLHREHCRWKWQQVWAVRCVAYRECFCQQF